MGKSLAILMLKCFYLVEFVDSSNELRLENDRDGARFNKVLVEF